MVHRTRSVDGSDPAAENALVRSALLLTLSIVAACSAAEEPPARRLKDTGVHDDAAEPDVGFLDATEPDTGFPAGCSVPQTVTLVENTALPGSMEASFLWNAGLSSCVLTPTPGPDTFLVFAAIAARLTASHPFDSGWTISELSSGALARPYQVAAIPYDTEVRIRSVNAASGQEVETKFRFGQADGSVSVTSFEPL